VSKERDDFRALVARGMMARANRTPRDRVLDEAIAFWSGAEKVDRICDSIAAGLQLLARPTIAVARFGRRIAAGNSGGGQRPGVKIGAGPRDGS
jgi:hypothetical protein